MISVNDLNDIRNRNRDKVNQGSDRKVVRIATCMATGGIAAGGKAVMDTIVSEVSQIEGMEVEVVSKGCAGLCSVNPLVDVLMPGQEKVTYVKMTPEKMRRVIREHVLGGKVVHEYTLHVANDVILNDYTKLDR